MPEVKQAWLRDILRQLDATFDELEFPAFINAYYPSAGMRITSFQNESEWLITIDNLVYSVKERLFFNMIFAFGNHISSPGYQSVSEVVTCVPNSPMWDEKGIFLLDLFEFTVKIRGAVKPFSVSSRHYRQAKINLKSDMDPALRMLRLLANLVPDELFLSNQGLLEACHRPHLPRFIQLKQWHHPSQYEREFPSQTICFQSLAQAIAENEPDLYTCPEPINSHWSDWEWV
ncbi:MAG: DUF7003 family protein [Ardenticatenaceae bacterium]